MFENPVVQKVVTQTKADLTYTQLRRLILDGDLAGNTVLNQEQLAQMLGVSTTPLREALRRLESESLVETGSKGQVRVTEVDADRLPHLLLVREQLDCLAARLAARAATPADLAAMQRSLAVNGGPRKTHADAWAANGVFHRAIHHATHNPVLIENLDRLYEEYDRHNRVFTDVVFFDDTAREEHAAILAAIEAGDQDSASAAMAAHYARAYTRLGLD